MKNLIIIPSRLESTRLPGKPLADINGFPMIVHVYKRAVEADIADVIVATGNIEIKKVIENAGGEAILTDPSHPSGSDRIYEAVNIYDPNKGYQNIVNLQGDLPDIDKKALSKIINLLENNDADISTLGAEIISEVDFGNPNIVKAYVKDINKSNQVEDFNRKFDRDKNKYLYHHIGIYGYKRESLKRFVELEQSKEELKRKLEQMRALENGMTIVMDIVSKLPVSVDTEEDLKIAREVIR
ncbi:MAG: 3-deoxy-manno-octulosonate cytidylyltransferase [Pseudomonadota bacterium]|nr:3-deoxy-manno-octulosonate cytidylyltransferase [Pseudomonadota bacterium]